MLSFAVCCTILLMSEYRYSQSSRWSLSKCSSLGTDHLTSAAMVIKGDRNQDVSDHKEQADLFAQFYESLAIPSTGVSKFFIIGSHYAWSSLLVKSEL
jgi:hypothetical protein